MATSTLTKPTNKQLGELLQQQQEPFVLDLYLIEKGYVKKGLNLDSKASFGCCNGNSNKFSKKGISRFSRTLRAIVIKFARNIATRNNTKSCEGKLSVDDIGQEVAEPDWFSSASSNTVSKSCSESDKDESPNDSLHEIYDQSIVAEITLEALRFSNVTENEVSVGGEFQCQFTANNKKQSPGSVLEQLPSSKLNIRTGQDQENIGMTCTVILPNKLLSSEDSNSKFSSSLCKLHFTSDSQKPIGNSTGIMELMKYNNTSQFPKSKRKLHQTRQLLLDCVREIVESHAKNSVKANYNCEEGVLGAEDLENLVLEKMKVWSKKVGEVTTKITYLVGLNFFDSAQEWFVFDQEKREICSEIADSIAEEIVKEFVFEL